MTKIVAASYLIALTTLHNPAKLPEYVSRVHELVPRYDGEFVREGPVTHMLENSIDVGGKEPDTGVIIRFPDEEASLRFFNSPEYEELREFRSDMATTVLFLVGEFPSQPDGVNA